ncbi:hypothetical protein C2S53_012309 [Perilla frutescens var. hirtella]|uniref:BZIP domain-containing protein n=1 Tax=Perilla frutescens var. hirtella TaxID=608512 RepID=A0AAD4IXT3_PERFH|nr:hypothetical protein C2S53_012309 [Perilla frutescens var. hirtella]
MQSNRESARRSRQRKQKHLDDLNAQIAQLSKENNQILNAVNAATQHCVKVEAENSVIRAQMMELSQRLQSLNQILNRTTSSSAASAAAAAVGSCMFGFEGDEFQFTEGFFFNNYQQPIMAAAQMFDC